MYKYSCIMVCSFCFLSSCASVPDIINERNTENEMVQYLLEAFLQSVNQWEGIEYARGPYQPDDYQTEINKYDQHIDYIFRYNKSCNEMVFTDPIEISICSELNDTSRNALIQTCQYINNESDIQNILSDLDLKTLSGIDVSEYIEIDRGEIIYRGKEKRNFLYGHRKINNNTYQLLLYRPFSKDDIGTFVNRRQNGFTMAIENGRIKPTTIPILGKDCCQLNEKQSFLLIGKLNDHEIQMCIDLLKTCSWEHSIYAIEAMDNQDSISSNDIKYITVYWGKPEHHLVMDSVIVKLENNKWVVSNVLSIELGYPISMYPVINTPISFRAKPQGKEVAGYASSLQAKCSIENCQGLEKQDFVSIAEFLLRLRCIEDYTDITLLKTANDTVEIGIEGIDCKNVRIIKRNNTWTINSFSTCIR